MDLMRQEEGERRGGNKQSYSRLPIPSHRVQYYYAGNKSGEYWKYKLLSKYWHWRLRPNPLSIVSERPTISRIDQGCPETLAF